MRPPSFSSVQAFWVLRTRLPGCGALVAAILICLGVRGAEPSRPQLKDPSNDNWIEVHRKAVDRRRRIIFNNDGNEPVYFCKASTKEALLDSRTAPLAGSQVDAIFYCTWSSGFGLFTHRTKAGEVFNTREAMFKDNRTQELLDQGIDPLEVMVEFAHLHGMELFWSMRMNDTHDGARAEYGPVMFRANRLKQEHPEWLMGTKEKPPKYGAWSAVDYGVDAIRDLAFQYCEEVAQNYDIDGLELDFFRHALFFRCSGRGEPCGDRERQAMTELVGRIRNRTHNLGRKRGRPILVAVRVPDSLDYCRKIGIDLESWLSQGLVDLLVVSGYVQLNPWEYSVSLARKYGVKVYPSLDEPRVRDESARQLRSLPATYRGRASNVWAAGADGVYMFNFFDPASSLWRELGDVEKLRRADRNYFASVLGSGAMPVPHSEFVQVLTLNPGNPLPVTAGKPTQVEISIGEPPLAGQRALLRLQVSPPTILLKASLNGQILPEGKLREAWLEIPLLSEMVGKGGNVFELSWPPEEKRSAWLLDACLTVTRD